MENLFTQYGLISNSNNFYNSWNQINHQIQIFLTSRLSGNASRYSLKNTMSIDNSPLFGKTYYFLGSSVTFGSASLGESMADFLKARNHVSIVKEAVSGTTLADLNEDSYVKRLTHFDTTSSVDGFIVQLSTNDSNFNQLGTIINSYSIDDFDTLTTYGAIEYIIAYARATWNCPIYFYTNANFKNSIYERMVKTLYEIAAKWHIHVIDLFNDKAFNQISDKKRHLYMQDDVHPTRAGYRNWWTPKFEEALNHDESYCK